MCEGCRFVRCGTVRNDTAGGAVRIDNPGSTATFRNTLFQNNTGTWDLAAIVDTGATGIFEACVFEGHRGPRALLSAFANASIECRDCVFRNNTI